MPPTQGPRELHGMRVAGLASFPVLNDNVIVDEKSAILQKSHIRHAGWFVTFVEIEPAVVTDGEFCFMVFVDGKKQSLLWRD